VSSIEHKKYPTEDIQTFISSQLQHLRSEVLKFDEVAAESRTAQEADLGLAGELQAERQQTQNLNEQLESARRAEGELDIRRVQLERQLADVDVAAHADNANPSNLVQVAEDFREKTKELEEECRIAKAEVERLQCNIKKRDRKLVDYDVSRSHAHTWNMTDLQ
jgi:chromosome segregation ATPase